MPGRNGRAELIGSELTISGSLQNVEPALQPSRGPQTYPLISWVAAGQPGAPTPRQQPYQALPKIGFHPPRTPAPMGTGCW
ncbi:hypothetical protein ACPA9J_00035 [Pseudomonas aeruginosa]